jgi:hypothetical protein
MLHCLLLVLALIAVGAARSVECVAATGPARMVSALDVSPARLNAEVENVYPGLALSRLKSAKLATPPTAGSVLVPDSLPLAGLAARAIVTRPA